MNEDQEGNEAMPDYTLSTYANGFGIWHCRITYPIALGNTGEAEAIIGRSMRAAKRAIRAAIVERMEPVKTKRLSYEVVGSDDLPSLNRMRSLTIAEA
jgi:hypothetical protein